MKLIDTHTHPQFPQYDHDRDEVIHRALDSGVVMVCVGTDLEISQRAIDLAQSHEHIWATVGLHPNDISSIDQLRIADYELLLLDAKVVAIGEVGLDYYRTADKASQEKQRDVFKQFIELALKRRKLLVVHCRDAHEDMIKILNSYSTVRNSNLCGVIHSFTSTWDIAQKYLDLGFYIGFNGIVTFTKDYDEAVLNTPPERILLETDAPYLTPIPHRGKRNESSYVKYVAQKVAEIKRLNFDEVARVTTLNAKRLFNIT